MAAPADDPAEDTVTDPPRPAEPASSRRIEPGPGIRSGLRGLPARLNPATIGAGVVAAVFGCTGPALIVIDGAAANGLPGELISSWIFGIYVFGGLISLVLALRYRMPVVGAYSIPGAVLVVGAMASYPFAEVVGAFLVAGVLVLALGLSGLIGVVSRWLPLPIVMAMIAGALIRFGTGVVDAAGSAPWIVGAAVVGFLVLSRFVPTVPGALGALGAGLVAAVLTTGFSAQETAVSGWTMPTLVAPAFDLGAILAVGIPLAVLVVAAENAQAYGVLLSQGYRPPINAMTVASGIGGLLAPLTGGHNANIAGPMTAICSGPQAGPDPEARYAASVVNGLIFIAFGVLAGFAVTAATALPSELVAAVAGLAMIGVLVSSFRGAFGEGRFRTGALTALVVAMSGIAPLGISSPFWALVAGVVASAVLEPADFRTAARG
ncbi:MULTISPECIES: benzoate/H(+) symporter BenE family transporter [Pseudonocardia]|uniref:Inner membrane protein YdcO n=2 Tax=Pseudonocardia TaxID=1847 RepID=A0A1Y2MPR4_PSEAH|nr:MULTISPECIES: benzoate/H(+) symporter BenE family transporter [Pseudonocardia]OSY37172.1 Inner membrane protein YdcO [Pseudonocardia autotrophica]TDN74793.1 benzoate membrane transport protein [Pseudonocardia autotrophica]BBG05568.1 benzoate transporter [Pseudonocardia autotrophica]GEC25819.1 benzoate transporter [Pseudonocardia saturnea]